MTIETDINDWLAQSQQAFQQRRLYTIEELHESDPEACVLVLADMACRLEAVGRYTVKADPADRPCRSHVYTKDSESAKKRTGSRLGKAGIAGDEFHATPQGW